MVGLSRVKLWLVKENTRVKLYHDLKISIKVTYGHNSSGCRGQNLLHAYILPAGSEIISKFAGKNLKSQQNTRGIYNKNKKEYLCSFKSY